MSVVYLHIGRGKTGTTAIQAAMGAMRSLLLDCGIHYILADDEGRGVGHQRFAKGFISAPPSYMEMPSWPEAVRAEVRREIAASKSGKIVISSENLTMANIGGLKDFLLSIPSVDAVRVVFFVRSQDELAESQYNQFVKLKALSLPFSEFLETQMDETDFDAMASAWADHFGESALICRVYDARSNDAVTQFMDCVGPETAWDIPSLPRRENESLGYFALQLLRTLNRAGVRYDRAQGRTLVEHLRDADAPALMLDADDAATYRERFRESNLRFSTRFLGKPMGDLGGRRFSDDERNSIRDQIRSALASGILA